MKKFIKIGLLLFSFEMFLERLWASEDAFIFFRYVDNFLQGHGLVFNIGNRVEGFTSPLWVFVLTAGKYITHMELRPLSMAIGLILSMLAVAILVVFDENYRKLYFPIGILLLITMSAFRDFGTSGFETALTYFLVIIVALLIKYNLFKELPAVLGLAISLLVLNRPESALILGIVALYYFYLIFKKQIRFTKALTFFIAPVILLGGYQIFRMGYYAAFFPNTYYAKKGGELYISQGFNYLKDFIYSYPIAIGIILVLSAVWFVNFKKKFFTDTLVFGRSFVLGLAFLTLFYVLRSGGDYMHGRSLLMFFILLCVAVNDLPSLIFEKFSHQRYLYYVALILVPALLWQKPYTVRHNKVQINYINDEREHFGTFFYMEQIGSYFNLPITNEFGWAGRGLYYRELAGKLNYPFSVVNLNIGYFGYAAGPQVSLEGAVLIDPIIARAPVEKRGKIGHENGPHWEYVFSRKPTFSYTPFSYWNQHNHFKWEQARFAGSIMDDSNDSFIPIFDLSNKEFLNRFSSLIGRDIKGEIDAGERAFLNSISANTLQNYDFNVEEYFGFLKVYWYPYATVADKYLYDSKEKSLFPNRKLSVYEKYYIEEAPVVNAYFEHITGPLTREKFISNIKFAIIAR